MTEPPQPPPPSPPPYGPGEPYGGEPSYPPPSGQWAQWGTPPPSPGLQIGQRLGARLWRRPEPRFGISLAAGGAALLLLGTLIWTGGYYGDGLDVRFRDSGVTTSGGSRRFLGAGLFLVLTVLGYLVAVRQRRGPLATSGAVAAAFGVPLAIGFVSLDFGAVFQGHYPFNLDAVFLASILIWVVSYLAVPGIRGRALFLALALIGIYTYIGFKAAGEDTLQSGLRNGLSPSASSVPDTTTLTAVALVFGVLYYAVAAVLDRRGRRGAAVAFVIAGFDATAAGVAVGTSDLKQTGTGVLLLFLGAGLAWYGGYFGRRFTTWAWSAGFVLGVLLIVADVAPDNYTAAGVALMVIGAIVAVGASLVSGAARERPDVEEPVPAGQ